MTTRRSTAAACVLAAGLAQATFGAAHAAIIDVTADITVSETWTANNEYILTKPIYVSDGATLTIEPGTVVRGEPNTPGQTDPVLEQETYEEAAALLRVLIERNPERHEFWLLTNGCHTVRER